MGRVNVRDGFWVLLAALWCVDEDNLLPLFLTAALVHEAGHAAALYLAGGRLRQLTLTACRRGHAGRASLRPFRLRGSQSGRADGWFCADDRGEGLRRMASCGASALLSLFNLLPSLRSTAAWRSRISRTADFRAFGVSLSRSAVRRCCSADCSVCGTMADAGYCSQARQYVFQHFA